MKGLMLQRRRAIIVLWGGHHEAFRDKPIPEKSREELRPEGESELSLHHTRNGLVGQSNRSKDHQIRKTGKFSARQQVGSKTGCRPTCSRRAIGHGQRERKGSGSVIQK